MNYEDLAENLFFQLRERPFISLNTIFNDFNRGEVGVLSYLAFDKDNVSSGELSEKINVSTARIASILNSLENKGLIKRNEDSFDKRKTLVSITEIGKNLVFKSKKEIKKKILNIIKEIGIEEIDEYVRISIKIRDILNKQ